VKLRTSGCILAATLAAVIGAPPAAAHVTLSPSFLPAGATTTLRVSTHNELDRPMTGFVLSVPAGFRVLRAIPAGPWKATQTAATATWSGGKIGPLERLEFEVELKTASDPGTVTLAAKQLYSGGGDVPWSVPFTVTPANEPSQRLGAALIVAILGLLALTIGGGLIWRRRAGALQER
jgi:uncharacterized protein YcnI